MPKTKLLSNFFVKKGCHSVLTATKALLRSSHGVLSRSYGVLVGDSLRSHDAFTALSRNSQCMLCAFTAFALCWWRVEDVRLHSRTAQAWDDESGYAETVYFPPALAGPKAFYAFWPSSVVVFQEWCEQRLQHFGTAGLAYRQAGVQLAGVRQT